MKLQHQGLIFLNLMLDNFCTIASNFMEFLPLFSLDLNVNMTKVSYTTWEMIRIHYLMFELKNKTNT
jgi:hypothetical protein